MNTFTQTVLIHLLIPIQLKVSVFDLVLTFVRDVDDHLHNYFVGYGKLRELA